MALRTPIEDGARVGHLLRVDETDKELMNDGPFTTVATGSTGAVTIPSYTTGSTTVPTTADGKWLFIGLDADGNQLFVPVFTIPA